MYGYIRPDKGDLKVSEYERFRGAYCGLCHVLRKRYGPACRFLVNYDFTFLAMLLEEEESIGAEPKRCPYHPFRKTLCPHDCTSLYAAADCTVILSYWKLRDGIADKGFFGALGCRIACLLLQHHYKKAAAYRPLFAASAAENLKALNELEASSSGSLDAVADCFAKILRDAADTAPEERRHRVLQELLYHLGRIVYILDAVDDLEEDVREGHYNPLRYRFELCDGKLLPEDENYLRGTLQLSHNAISGAFGLMEPNAYSSILSNIIYRGLPSVTQAVFDGNWKSLQKTKRDRSHL